MSKMILTVELVWKKPLWIFNNYKYGFIIVVGGRKFRLLFSRKIPQKEIEKRKQESLKWLEMFKNDGKPKRVGSGSYR